MNSEGDLFESRSRSLLHFHFKSISNIFWQELCLPLDTNKSGVKYEARVLISALHFIQYPRIRVAVVLQCTILETDDVLTFWPGSGWKSTLICDLSISPIKTKSAESTHFIRLQTCQNLRRKKKSAGLYREPNVRFQEIFMLNAARAEAETERG